MDTLYAKIELAQNGNEPAMLELIQQFTPLLKKYAYLLQTEDAFEDLRVDFIELIKELNLNSLRSHSDGVLVTYISNSIRSKYILHSKLKQMEKQTLYWADLEESIQRKFEPHNSLFTSEEEFVHTLPKDLLAENEYTILTMIYLYGYTAAEIARKNNITRQAVNQVKWRALKKLQQVMGIETKYKF